MSLISLQINQLSDSKIFCAPNQQKTHQLVILSNEVNNLSNGNAIIIPVPLPQTLKIHDLTGYTDFFSDCSSCFKNPTRLSSLSYKQIDKAENSQYYRSGSYIAYIAPNIENLYKLDGKKFILSKELKQVLETYYYQQYWGFIILSLNPGTLNYHPFGYSHQIIQNKIYLPTRHHLIIPDFEDANNWSLGLRLGLDGSTPINTSKYDESNIDKSPMFAQDLSKTTTPENFGWFGKTTNKNKSNSNINNKNQNNKDNTVEWNHEIYFYNINPYSNPTIRNINFVSCEWDNQNIPALSEIDFPFGRCTSFEKIKIKGSNPNLDILL